MKKRWLLKADDPNHQRFGGRRETPRTRTTSSKTINVEISKRYGSGVGRRETTAHHTTILISYIGEKCLEMKGSGD